MPPPQKKCPVPWCDPCHRRIHSCLGLFTRLHTTNNISIGSAVLAQFVVMTNKHRQKLRSNRRNYKQEYMYVLLYEGKCKWSYGPSCPADFPLNIFIQSFIPKLWLTSPFCVTLYCIVQACMNRGYKTVSSLRDYDCCIAIYLWYNVVENDVYFRIYKHELCKFVNMMLIHNLHFWFGSAFYYSAMLYCMQLWIVRSTLVTHTMTRAQVKILILTKHHTRLKT